MEVLIRSDERLLGQILGLGELAHLAEGQTVRGVLVAPDQFAKGVPIAGQTAIHVMGVVSCHFFCSARSGSFGCLLYEKPEEART